jgi:predicted enzyme related to lactoylglutathione lyase
MTSRVIHFDIPIDDPARAGTFYASVFDWSPTPWGPVPYWPMTTGAEPGIGAEGALAPREDAPEGVVVYISVDDIEEALARITAAGGTLVTERMPVPTIGWTARFRDTEGNLIGLIQEDASVGLPGDSNGN